MGQPRSAAGSCLLLSWQKRPYIFACPHHNGAVGRKHDVVRSIEPRATSSIMHCSMAMRHSADDGSCDRPNGRANRTAAVQRCSGVSRCPSYRAGSRATAWRPKALDTPHAALCDLRDRPGFTAASAAKCAASAVNALD